VSAQRSAYHLLAKPAGAACNLGCQYCFFLSKENLYPARESPLMPDDVLETYVRQLMESSFGPQVEVSWQGGEPMLRGIDFFRRSVALANTYQEDANALATWYSGWYNGLAHKHYADFKKGRIVEHQVIEYCKAHQDQRIIHAISVILKEDRAEGLMMEK
jgi:organic radical activating enzyme